MKKLLTLTLSIALASTLKAASFSWGFESGGIMGPTGYTDDQGFIKGGYAVLYIGSVEIARASQSVSEYNFGIFDNTASDSTGNVQTLPDGDISSSFSGQEFKLVLRTDDNKYEIVYEGTSSYAKVAGVVGENTKNYETFKTSIEYAASAWKSTAVPEPTSGLLLLIGVAGLALKRKRA